MRLRASGVSAGWRGVKRLGVTPRPTASGARDDLQRVVLLYGLGGEIEMAARRNLIRTSSRQHLSSVLCRGHLQLGVEQLRLSVDDVARVVGHEEGMLEADVDGGPVVLRLDQRVDQVERVGRQAVEDRGGSLRANLRHQPLARVDHLEPHVRVVRSGERRSPREHGVEDDSESEHVVGVRVPALVVVQLAERKGRRARSRDEKSTMEREK